MKQIYDFEQCTPPVLNENMLHMKLEERRKRQQMILAAIGSVLLQTAMLFTGFLTKETYPLIAFAGFLYLLISTVGGSVITIVYVQKGGTIL